MRHTLVFLLSAVSMLGQNLYSLQGRSGSGGIAVPSGAPWSSLSNLRIEFRFHNWTAGSGRVFEWGDFYVNMTGTSISATSFYEPGSPSASRVFPVGSTDVVVRLQRTSTRWQMEMWNADGSGYVSGTAEGVSGSPISLASTTLHLMRSGGGAPSTGPLARMAWFRVFSTSAAVDSTPPSNASVGDLLNFEFEGNGNETSGRGLNLTMAGAPVYPETPVVPQLGESQTVRAGASFSLNCGGTNASSYFWQQLSGPQMVTFSSRTVAAPTIRGANVFGQYQFQCTARNALGSTGATTLNVGAVATNPNNVVIPGVSAIGFTTGEMLRGGTSPWPFYDRHRPRRALAVGALLTAAMAADINTPLAGTVSVANGSTSVTGVGTSFTSQYSIGSKILFYYRQAGGGIGRIRQTVSAIASNTSLTLSTAFTQPTQSGIQHQRWGTGDGGGADGAWAEGYNYYDNILALYTSYYKTGLSQIAAYADQMAAYWWLYCDLGQNYGFAPRQISLDGLAIAAQRGVIDPTAFYTYVDNYSWSWSAGTPPGYRNYVGTRNTTFGNQNFYFGARESGYSFRHAVMLAQQHPNSGVRATWLSRLETNIQNHYRDFQCKASNPANPGRCRAPEGAFRWEDSAWGADFSELPWHTGIIMQGLIRYHRLTSNPVAQSVMTDWVNHLMVNTQPNGPGNPGLSLYQNTVASSFPGINCRGYYYWHLRGSTTTLMSPGDVAAGCPGPPEAIYGMRDTNNEIVSSMGYAFRLTGNAGIRARGDDMFGGTWGADDGYFGQWVWEGAPNQGKTHGQGLCCNDSYLVDRLGTVAASRTPLPLPLRVGFRLQTVAGAVSVRLTVVRPDGQSVSADCTSSPCSVAGDQQQGEHRFRLEYRSAGGAVLQSSELQPVRVGS